MFSSINMRQELLLVVERTASLGRATEERQTMLSKPLRDCTIFNLHAMEEAWPE